MVNLKNLPKKLVFIKSKLDKGRLHRKGSFWEFLIFLSCIAVSDIYRYLFLSVMDASLSAVVYTLSSILSFVAMALFSLWIAYI